MDPAPIGFENSKGMLMDGVASSESLDSQAERVMLAGIDISTLATSGTINVEHLSSTDEKVVPGEETIGRILFAKKIFSPSDCATDREKHYWDKVKLPYLYIVYRLYDAAGHRGAQAFAAQIRDAVAHGEKILVRLSVEGSTISKKDNVITESVARKVSATLQPANRTCDVGLISDPQAPPGFDKGADPSVALQQVEKCEDPLRRPLGSYENVYLPFESKTDAALRTVVRAKLLTKALEAGGYNVAPSNLVGGSALQVEDRGLRHRLRRAVEEYKPTGPFNRDEFKEIAKNCLPQVSDSFLDHFADIAHDYHLKRMRKSLDEASLISAMQAASIDLRKAEEEVRSVEPEQPTHEFAGHRVRAGKAHLPDGDYDVLHEGPDAYVAVPEGEKPTPYNLVRLPRSKENTHFRVSSRPAVFVADLENA